MYIKDGIAYAGEPILPLKVISVKPLSDYKLLIKFNSGETKIFDFKSLLDYPAFLPLKDDSLFKEVYIDHGITMWKNGEIDISPEKLYEKGELVEAIA